jgi:hypothetical protein
MTDDAKQEREAVLLPCPFCGNPPKSGDGTYGYWLIFCSDENNCPAQPSVGHKTEAEAIAAWNTRQPQTDAIERALCEANGCVWDLNPDSDSRQQWSRDVAIVLAALKERK